MIKKALFTAAAVAGLLSASISAQAGTCPVTGAKADGSKAACESGKKEECKDKEAKKDKSACGEGACKDKK